MFSGIRTITNSIDVNLNDLSLNGSLDVGSNVYVQNNVYVDGKVEATSSKVGTSKANLFTGSTGSFHYVMYSQSLHGPTGSTATLYNLSLPEMTGPSGLTGGVADTGDTGSTGYFYPMYVNETTGKTQLGPLLFGPTGATGSGASRSVCFPPSAA